MTPAYAIALLLFLLVMYEQLSPGRDSGWMRKCMECGCRMRHAPGCSRDR